MRLDVVKDPTLDAYLIRRDARVEGLSVRALASRHAKNEARGVIFSVTDHRVQRLLHDQRLDYRGGTELFPGPGCLLREVGAE